MKRLVIIITSCLMANVFAMNKHEKRAEEHYRRSQSTEMPNSEKSTSGLQYQHDQLDAKEEDRCFYRNIECISIVKQYPDKQLRLIAQLAKLNRGRVQVTDKVHYDAITAEFEKDTRVVLNCGVCGKFNQNLKEIDEQLKSEIRKHSDTLNNITADFERKMRQAH